MRIFDIVNSYSNRYESRRNKNKIIITLKGKRSEKRMWDDMPKYGYDPEKTLLHGTSLERAQSIKKEKLIRAGTLVGPLKQGFEKTGNWAHNSSKDPVIVIGEVPKDKSVGFGHSWGGFTNVGPEDWEGYGTPDHPSLPLEKIKIFKVTGTPKEKYHGKYTFEEIEDENI